MYCVFVFYQPVWMSLCACVSNTAAMWLAWLEGRISGEHCLGPQTFHIKKWKGNLHYYQCHITSPLPPPLLLLHTALTARAENTSHWQEIPLFLMPLCQQHTSNKAKKGEEIEEGEVWEKRWSVCVCVCEGGLSSIVSEWEDRRKPDDGSIHVLDGVW